MEDYILKETHRLKRLPPYVFSTIDALKKEARARGEDIIDFGMGNPDQATPGHIVDKMVEAAANSRNHRYSASRGIYKLRLAITDWYKRNFNVDLDPDTEAIATMGAKEGLSHLVLSIMEPGDIALVPNPTYPIHIYSVVIAGAEVRSVPLTKDGDFFADLNDAFKQTWPKPKLLIISFPHNPTTAVVEIDFFEKIVDFAKTHEIMVIHDFAYRDLVFDGYQAPSFLQVDGGKDVGVELFTLSKSYNMPGWRVGFCVGNREMVAALEHIKSYLDYGIFQPIQIAGIIALNEDQNCVEEIISTYRSRRDTLANGLARIGWNVQPPQATMFLWAQVPEEFRSMGSLEFSKMLLAEANVAVSPGIGFGEYGDEFVRFALVENEHRTRQAIRGIRKAIMSPALE